MYDNQALVEKLRGPLVPIRVPSPLEQVRHRIAELKQEIERKERLEKLLIENPQVDEILKLMRDL